MAKVAPGKPRAKVTRTADGLEIRMSPQRKTFGIMLLVFFVFFFLIFLMAIIAPHPQRPGQPPDDVVAVMFPFFFMLLFFCPFIWVTLSQEVVKLRPRELAYGRKLFGIGRMKEFDLSEVKDLRVAPQAANPWFGWYGGYASFMTQAGTLAFDYGYKTYRFGAGLEEAEAKYLLKEIGGRFPSILEKPKAP